MTEDKIRSKRVINWRTNNQLENISFLMPRGGIQLCRAVALREYSTIRDMLNRCVMEHAGLQTMPIAELDALADKSRITTRREAEQAIRSLQMADAANRGEAEPLTVDAEFSEWSSLLLLAERINSAIERTTATVTRIPVELDTEIIRDLKTFLSRAERAAKM